MSDKKEIIIKINLEDDFKINLDYDGLVLDDGDKIMLAIATKAVQEIIYDTFKLEEFLKELFQKVMSENESS